MIVAAVFLGLVNHDVLAESGARVNLVPSPPLAAAANAVSNQCPTIRPTISVKPRSNFRDAREWLACLAKRDSAFLGARVLRESRLGVVDLALDANVRAENVARRLAATGAFEFVEVASRVEWHGVPNDPGFASAWHLHNTGQHGGRRGADVSAAWAFEIEDGDPRVTIAIIDSGVDTTHLDLLPNLWIHRGEIPHNHRDDDHNGYVDDFIGYDFEHGDVDAHSQDDHGTAVAGVLGAVGNNGLGVVGLAGGGRDASGCTLMPLRIGGEDANGSAIDDAILYAIDHGARVICLALGVRPSPSIDLALDAAQAADVVVIASAGNHGEVSYPASSPWVIAVSGTNGHDHAGLFSRGPRIAVAAPAVNILTTLPGGGYGLRTGTSFAAPQVAALAGLLLSLSKGLVATQVRAILESTATDVDSPGIDETSGHGRIDAWRALTAGRAAIPQKIAILGSAVAGSLDRAPVITTNGAPALAGRDDFGIVLASAPADRVAWLFVADSMDSAFPGPFGAGLGARTLVIPVRTDFRGEALAGQGLTRDASAAGRRLFARWCVLDELDPAASAWSRILAITVGS